MRQVKQIVQSAGAPNENEIWLNNSGDEPSLKTFKNGKWQDLAGGVDEDDIATDEDIDSITKEEFDKRQYFTIEGIEDETALGWLMPTTGGFFSTVIEWSKDGGKNWHRTTSANGDDGNIGYINAGEKIIFRHDGPTGFYDEDGIGDAAGSFFYADKPCYVYGNIMSLLFSSNFATQDDVKYDYALTNLFRDYDEEYTSNWVRFKEGSPLLLPATKLTKNCYACMFTNCLNITTAPELPATALAFECYRAMFSNCTSLASAPKLPATTLVDMCYSDMFVNCISLTVAPKLPATTLTQNCYSNMFYHCTSLTTAPELPAITLKQGCYTRMFSNCTSLTAAPKLPATTVASHCYDKMFRECTSLAAAPELPATTVTDYCYSGMFFGCTSLTEAPALPATTLEGYCYNSMFYGCTSLASVKCLASAVSTFGAVGGWLHNVSATGTFTKATGVEWPTGESGIPSGWTVIEE